MVGSVLISFPQRFIPPPRPQLLLDFRSLSWEKVCVSMVVFRPYPAKDVITQTTTQIRKIPVSPQKPSQQNFKLTKPTKTWRSCCSCWHPAGDFLQPTYRMWWGVGVNRWSCLTDRLLQRNQRRRRRKQREFLQRKQEDGFPGWSHTSEALQRLELVNDLSLSLAAAWSSLVSLLLLSLLNLI